MKKLCEFSDIHVAKAGNEERIQREGYVHCNFLHANTPMGRKWGGGGNNNLIDTFI